MQNHVMQNHVMQNHVMQKPCNMRRVRWRLHCEKTCKLFVSCKKQAVPHAMKKPRAKPCKHAKTMQHAARTLASTQAGAARLLRRARQPAEHPLSAASLLYVLYVLYLTRQATEHPLSAASLLYVLYVLYLTRQATEHPLPPGSMLYVLYVLYLTRQATEHPLSPSSMLYVLYVLYGPYIAYIVQISRVQSI